MSRDQVSYRVRSGVWIRVAGRAYTLAATRPTGRAAAHAASLTWPDATLYGPSSPEWWEPDAPIALGGGTHCAVPHARNGQPGLVVHRVIVDDAEATVREGIRVQRRTPALIATLAALAPREAQALLAWMVARGKVNREEFTMALDAFAPRKHCSRVRRYVPLVAAKAASEAELVARSIFIRFGIRGWQANALVKTVRGEAKSADFYFVEQRLIVMIDGWAYHGSRKAFQIDRSDQNSLVIAGYTILRFTFEDLTRRETQVAEDVATALRRLTQEH
jgi:hypothetical protein